MRSGFSAAMVFGVTSAKTSTTNVSTPVATATPKSPQRRIPMIVAIADAEILTKLLPIKINPIKRSGRSSNFKALIAPLWPLLAKWRKR